MNVVPMHQNNLMAAAVSYAALGWHILPCWWIEKDPTTGERRCACGDAACKSPGKHPINKLVRFGQSNATTDVEIIRQWWERFPMANVAVHLAPSKLVAIDIDPRNGGWQTIHDLESKFGPLRSDLTQFSGGGGEHRLLILPENMLLPGTLGPGIDVKVNGYILLDPSNHISGGVYSWEASSDPREGSMPSPMPDWLRDLAPAARTSFDGGVAMAGAAAMVLAPETRAEIVQALELIPADSRDVWVQIGMALHSTDDKNWAFEVWDQWSQKSKKYDPVDQTRVWYSFKSNRSENLTYRSIFALAKREGWTVHQQAQAAKMPDDATLKAKVMKPEFIAQQKPTHAIRPIPVESINSLANWFTRSFESTHPLVSQASALLVASAAASRRFVSPYGDPASVYMAVLAPSVSQARYSHHGVDQVMFDAGMRAMLRSTRMSSPLQLCSTLFKSPACLYLSDDYGDQLRFSKRQPSGLLEQTLSLLTGRIHGAQTLVLDNWAEVGTKQPDGADHQPVIYSPSLSMLALVGTQQMAGMFKAGEFARGAIDSVMLVCATEQAQWTQKPKSAQEPIPIDVLERVRLLRGFADPSATQLTVEQIFGGNAGIMPTPTVVRFVGPVQQTEAAWIAAYANQGHQVRQLASGARGHFRRLCTAMAAWANPADPIATDEIVRWCADFVRQCLDVTIAEAKLRSSDDSDRDDVYQKVIEFIDEFGATGVSKRDVRHGCRAFRAMSDDKRDLLIEQMEKDESIVLVPTPTGRSHMLVRSTYVKVNTPKATSGDNCGRTGDATVPSSNN